MEECCSKIELEDGRSLYFSIKGVELEGKSGWSLILTDGVTVYDAEVSEDLLTDMAVGSSYSPQEFLDLFKMAFNLQKADDSKILKYTLTASSKGKDCFFWSEYLPNDNKTFRLGTLEMRPLPESERAPVYCRMFDSLLSVTRKSKQEADKCYLQSEEDKKCAKLACQKLDKFVTVQEQCEKVLYTNFVAILNEKKRKIRELQDQCESLKLSLASESAAPSQEVKDESQAPARRGRGGKAGSRRAAKSPVSACVAAKRRQQKPSEVKYDSEGSTDIEDNSVPTRKRSKILSQSSDDEATDVDETTPQHILNKEEQKETDDAADSSPGAEVSHAVVSVSKELSTESPPIKSRDVLTTPIKKIDTEALLDDLLTGATPTAATSAKQKSPVKRRSAVKAAPPVVVPKARPTRKQKATPSSVDDSLIDDLLQGI
ncbi:XRCC4 [Bugula neritina]|uniref:XRCC4 n=1 Tax=Bugula neritina TaxID=10212 RepID=A0A7J7JWP9_BUGNE|nr:XRCC4 [Bugula neritina]